MTAAEARPRKEAMLDDAGNTASASPPKRGRVGNSAERCVKNMVAAVRDERTIALQAERDQPGQAKPRRPASSIAPLVAARPNGTTSIGNGNAPITSTSFDSSAATSMRRDAAATIFSRSSAPPPPLISASPGPISSAPSTVRSRIGSRSSVVSGIFSASARRAVRSEVGTPTISRPDRTRSPRSRTKGLGRTPGAEPELHARPDFGERRFGRAEALGLATRPLVAHDNPSTANIRRFGLSGARVPSHIIAAPQPLIASSS